jgi:protein-tyrosine phosphatase
VEDRPEIEKSARDLQKLAESLPERLRKSIKSTAKWMLPEAVVQEVQQYRAYERSERPIYLKARISSRLGLGLSRPPNTARSFVFVCFGNIMRSPMCEALMNRAVTGFPDLIIKVTSAGLNAIAGRPAHPWAIMAAQEFGISLENHRARLLTSEMVEQADAIFVMDNQNKVQLLSRWSRATSKVFMLGAYAPKEYRGVEIRDPYYLGQDETRYCYQILNTCIQNLAHSLPSRPQIALPKGAEPVAKQ